MTAPMVTSSTGSSLQRLAERSWERNAADSVLHYEVPITDRKRLRASLAAD